MIRRDRCSCGDRDRVRMRRHWTCGNCLAMAHGGSWTSTSRPTGRKATWRPGEGRSGSSAEHPSRSALPRWMLTIPNPDRTKRLVRFGSRACAVIGLFGLTVGTLQTIAGAPGGWFNTVWSVALLWQAWALAGHGRESVRFVAIRLTPLLFFVIALLVTGAAAFRTLAQDTNIGRGVAFGCAALLDLFLVTIMARLAIHDWPRI